MNCRLIGIGLYKYQLTLFGI